MDPRKAVLDIDCKVDLHIECLQPYGSPYYTVWVDDEVAHKLTIDEALGCIASALFSDKAMFVRDPRPQSEREKKMGDDWLIPTKLTNRFEEEENS